MTSGLIATPSTNSLIFSDVVLMRPDKITIRSHQSVGSQWLFCLALGLLSIAMVGCSKATTDETTAHGFVETQFTDKQGNEHTYLVFVPYDYEPGQKRPLILFLNGKGENGNDGYWTIHNNFGVEIWEMNSPART